MKKIFFVLFIVTLCFVGVSLTGSRGGLPIIGVVIFAYYHSYNKYISIRKVFLMFFLLMFFLVIFFIGDFDFISNSRFSNFDYESNKSLALRVAPWLDFYTNFSDWILSFGQDYNNFLIKFGDEQFPYPHNIFLELIYFNGIFGFVLSLLIVYSYLNALKYTLFNKFTIFSFFFYMTSVVLIGGMFSGDLQDNFSFISLLILLEYVKMNRFFFDAK